MANKILLLSTPRSGSTYICNVFGKALPDHKVLMEPWCKKRFDPAVNFKDYDKVIVKNHIRDLMEIYPDTYLDIINEFDIVHKIVRKCMLEQVLSLAIAKHTNIYHRPKIGLDVDVIKVKRDLLTNCFWSINESTELLCNINATNSIVYEKLFFNVVDDAMHLGLDPYQIQTEHMNTTQLPPKQLQIINYDECVEWFNELKKELENENSNIRFTG
jgi:hypothetical protein